MNNTFPSSDPLVAPMLPNTPSPAEVRRTFSLIGLAYAAMTLGLQITVIACQYLLAYLAPAVLSTWWISWVLSIIPLYTVGLGILWLVIRRVPVFPHNTDYAVGITASADKPSFGLGHWLILLVIAFGCMTAGGLVGNTIMSILSAVMDYDYANALGNMVSSSPVWVTFVGACICAPLGEELLFRKLLIDRTRRFGDLPSILVSGLLFGLFHGNLFQFFYAFLLGMILAYMYTRTDNLWWCVAMHAVINLLGSIVIPAIGSVIPTDGSEITSIWPILATLFLLAWEFGFIIVGIVLFCVFWHRRKLSPSAVLLPGKGMAPVFLNPGMVVCLACMIGITVLGLIPR